MHVRFGATCEGQAAEVSSIIILVAVEFSFFALLQGSVSQCCHSVCAIVVIDLNMFR